jgi:hypothetical protein
MHQSARRKTARLKDRRGRPRAQGYFLGSVVAVGAH